MDLWVTLGVLVRRWYLTVPLIAAVAFISLSVSGSLKPTFEASATVRILCPDQIIDPVNGGLIDSNPFCADRTVLDITGDMGVLMRSRETRRNFNSQGLDNDYDVDDTDPPRLTITAENEDAQVTLDTVRTAATFIEQQVEEIQPNREDVYTTFALDIPQEAEEIASGRARMMITIIVSGLIFAVMLVHLVDALLVFWKRRKELPADPAVAAVAATARTYVERRETIDSTEPDDDRRSVPAAEDAGAQDDDEADLRAVAGDASSSRWGR